MSDNYLSLYDFPKSVRYAFFFLLAGWCWHLFFIYAFFTTAQDTIPTKMLYQQLAIAGLLGYFLYRAKKWARALCLLCNALIILLYGCFAALFFSSRLQLAVLAVVVIGCFAAATYLLMLREAKDFFSRKDDAASGKKGRET